MRRIKKRLCGQKGETIAETLVALLISALALVMLAGAISASSKIVDKSRDKMGDYYDANQVMVNMPNSVDSTSQVTLASGTMKFSDTTSDSNRQLSIGDQSITYYQNNVFGSTTPITIYKLSGTSGD